MKLNFDFLAGYKTKIFTVLFISFLWAEILKWGVTKDDFKSLEEHQEIIIAILWILYWLFMKWWRNDFNIKNILTYNDTLSSYIKKKQWSYIDYDKAYGSQCVDLAKDYAKDVLWISLWSFWGSAKTGWYNKSNTFSSKKWQKIINNPNDKNQTPNRWDIVFFEGWNFHPEYGHVAVIINASAWEKTIEVLEQNWGSGNWNGKWENAIRLKNYSYNWVAWWYRKIG